MWCGLCRRKKLPLSSRTNVLLTNGRFPVSLDLARQLHLAGHTVYVVDPMQYHVCAFSLAVKQSQQVPAPPDDAEGYIKGVVDAVKIWNIDLILPVHEEIFFLAESREPDILDRLFAPPFELLVRLHDKWEFTRLMKRLGLDVLETYICKSYEDVKKLPVDEYEHGLALKPCFGQSSTNVYHLRPGEPVPKPEDVNIGDHRYFIAQQWVKGNRYCSYSVIRDGRAEALGVYPVLDTIDGSSSVFFRQVYHAEIYRYIDGFVSRCAEAYGPFNGQLAFDFVEDTQQSRVVIIDSNPRSTSGIHLWTRTPDLAYSLTNKHPDELREDRPIQPPNTGFIIHRPAHAQVAAGMLMWEHKEATLGIWASHMTRLIGTRDVIWRYRDFMPTIAQPFLLTVYYRMCREKGLPLPLLFQLQLLWRPEGAHLKEVRRIMTDADHPNDQRIDSARSSCTFENDESKSS